jgi:carbon storage regulator
MLVLSRKPGEELVIGDNIRLSVVAIRGSQVRLGITVPVEMPIRRGELPCSDGRCHWPLFLAAHVSAQCAGRAEPGTE